MKKTSCIVISFLLLFVCAVPAHASDSPGAGWSPVYEAFILNEEYFSWTEPEFYKDDPLSIRFGLYDLDKDGFPELIAYNGCPYMAGACNYVFTCRNGQLTYLGDAGYRGSVLQYYPTGDYPGLFCTDGNMGFFITTYYEMTEGKITEKTVMEQDHNARTDDGDPTINQVTEDDSLFLLTQTEKPVTLQMFTASEIRAMGWQELISRYPFVAESTRAGEASASGEHTDRSGSAASDTPFPDTDTHAPFYGVWCSASKDPADMQTAAKTLRQQGFDARVLVTTDWDNLNPEMWYVLSAGTYATEAAANAALPQIRTVYPDAYVKYSGEYIGG